MKKPEMVSAAQAEEPESSLGDALPNGTSLLNGQYIIDGYLNSGGFGITYYARDSLDRRVVLKECFPSTICCRNAGRVSARSSNMQPEFETIVSLFGQEARRLAKLNHPNIVGVRDVFEENGTAYMALDLISGRDLQDVISFQPERLTPEVIRKITFSLLDAIGHVHARGMLHRDISPDNVLLDADDTPILIDFGAARDNARRKTRVLSALHVVKDGFSPQEFYMQAGEHLPASDLFSIAATIYTMITGQPPVVAHHRLAAVAERKPDPYVPLTGTTGAFDDRFLRMVDKALSLFTRDRPKDAADWLEGIIAKKSERSLTQDDREIVDRIRKLVEATNPEVKRLQAQREKERQERERKLAAESAKKEEKRLRAMEIARQEAEEAASVSKEKRRRDAHARKREADLLSREVQNVRTNPDGTVDPASVVRVPQAAGVNRAQVLREREEKARQERLQAEEDALKKKSHERPPEQGQKERHDHLFSRILSRGLYGSKSNGNPSSKGYGT